MIDKYINKVLKGDNLEILKQIPDNSIDLAYIDPPFSTGRVFKTKQGELAYEDKFTLEELIGFLIPRIKEIHRILKDTGSFYIHGDYRFIPYIRVECDKIFGIDNFRNEIIWSKGFNGTESKNFFQSTHDTVLLYTKSNKFYWNNLYIPYEKATLQRYNKKDENGQYGLIKRKRTDGSVYYGKCYLKKGKKANDVIEHYKQKIYLSKEYTGYPTQKPKSLIGDFLKASLPYGNETNTYSGIVLDCFAGSGTTLEVAKELGANYIGCDNSDTAIKYINERLSKIS